MAAATVVEAAVASTAVEAAAFTAVAVVVDFTGVEAASTEAAVSAAASMVDLPEAFTADNPWAVFTALRVDFMAGPLVARARTAAAATEA